MRCPSCTPDYCACADFYGGRLKYWKGEIPMTDKPTAPDLAALSAAATQAAADRAYYGSGTLRPEETTFHTALANEYGAGNLVQIDEGMRERDADAARYRWLRDHSCPPHNFYISVPDEFHGIRYTLQDVDAYIDAAIAAMMGGTK